MGYRDGQLVLEGALSLPHAMLLTSRGAERVVDDHVPQDLDYFIAELEESLCEPAKTRMFSSQPLDGETVSTSRLPRSSGGQLRRKRGLASTLATGKGPRFVRIAPLRLNFP